MRVAYVCADPGVPVFGRKGCSIHVQEVIRAMVARGMCVDVIAARLGGSAPLDLHNVRVYEVRIDGDPGEAGAREQTCVRANSRVRRMLDALGPLDLVYERYSLWSFAAMRWAQRSHVPGLLEVNAPLVDEQAQHRGLCDRATAVRIAGMNFTRARAVVAVSTEVAAWIGSFPDTAGRIHVIPNGVDPSRFGSALQPQGRPEDGEPSAFTIGFVGTLKAWHGLSLLVQAFAELHAGHRDSRLLIVGDGPGRRQLEEELTARGLEAAAALTGAVDPHAIPGLLASMDVAVAPYSGARPFYFSPLKVLEYMAAGLPVVATRLGQLEGLITDGVTGLLCPPDDSRALAACLRRLRSSRELRRRLGVAARAAVANGHTWDAVVRRSLALVGLTAPGSGAWVTDPPRVRAKGHG